MELDRRGGYSGARIASAGLFISLLVANLLFILADAAIVGATLSLPVFDTQTGTGIRLALGSPAAGRLRNRKLVARECHAAAGRTGRRNHRGIA